MNFWILCLLAIVQGLTEFLPVSSSGHLLFVEQIIGVKGDLLMLNLFFHLATLFAVIIVYRKVLLNLIRKPLQPLTYKLLLSTVLTLCFAFTYKFLNLKDFDFYIYGFCFIITSIILYITYIFQQKASVVTTENISTKSAAIVGIVQGFAVLPGISRSGSTISSLILMGNDEGKAAEYSFLLSLPVIIGGFALEIIELYSSGGQGNVFSKISIVECLVAFILTFAVAMISLKLTLKLLKNNKFIYFSIYLLILGVSVICLNFL